MAYNFPDSPVSGTVFSPTGGPTWRYLNGAWTQESTVDIPLVGAQHFNSMAQAVASNIAADTQLVTLNGYYTAGDLGAARWKKVTLEPFHQCKFRSADGAWWEIAEHTFTLQMFGAKADGVFDDWPAFQKALSFRWKDPPAWIYYPAGPSIYFPFGTYWMASIPTTGAQIKAGTRLQGDNLGIPNSFQHALLKFPANCAGLVLNGWNQLNGAIEPVPTGSAGGTTIRHLFLQGGYGTNTNAHGIYINVGCTIEHTGVGNFAGNGIHMWAVAPDYGNANCWQFYKVSSYSNGLSGIYVDGPDVNAGVGLVCDCSSNGRWGIWDSSFIGNTWIGCHTASNGIAQSAMNGSTKSSVVDYSGIRYYAAATATEAQLVATTPGTNNAIWVSMGPPAYPHYFYPNWLAAQPVGTYFVGGAYYGDAGSAPNLFLGCYAEGDQAPSIVVFPGQVIGGIMGNAGSGMLLGGSGTWRSFTANSEFLHRASPGGYVILGNGTHNLISLHAVNDHVSGFSLGTWREDMHCYIMQHAGLDGRAPLWLTGEGCTVMGGRTVPIPPGQIALAQGIYLGGGQRFVTTGAAAPTTEGAYATGEITFNTAPTAGGKVGWVCTTAGTIAPAWVTGTNYNLNSLILAAGPKYYRCTTDGGTSSTVQPSHTSGAVTGADGFGWTYLGAVAAVFKPFGAIDP